jgi:hypothetical protein
MNLNPQCLSSMTPEELVEYNQKTARMILDSVAEGAGHLYTSDEISWALQITGDIPLPNNQ